MTHFNRAPHPPARSRACASSTSRPWSPVPLPRRCSPISARTCSRSKCPASATRCGGSRRTRTACRCGGRSPTATRRASRSICASPTARRCSASCIARARRAGGEFPHRHARRMGHHAGMAAGRSIRGSPSCALPASARPGPIATRPGFARVFEAMSGFTRMCGEEGGTPLHLGYPISDAIGGLFGAIGVLAELYRLKGDPALRGQEIDCSVTEAMMRTLDFLAIEYDQLGAVRTAERQPQPVCRARQHLRDLGRQMGLDRGLDAEHLRAAFARARARAAARRSALRRQPVAGEELARDRRDRRRGDLRASRSTSCATGSMPMRSASRRSTTPPTFLPTRISSRARQSSACPTRSSAMCACNAWCRAFRRHPVAVRRAGPSLGQHNDEVFARAWAARRRRSRGCARPRRFDDR